MKGLLIKDLLSIKRQARVYLFLAVLWIVMSTINKDTAFFQGFTVLLCSMMPITALAYDERAHFEKYALTMPLSRKDIVLSKYLLGLICTGVAVIIGSVFEILLSLFIHAQVSPTMPLTLSTLFGIGLLFISFTMPIMFKFGTEKGRIVYMAVAVLAVLLPTLEKKGAFASSAIDVRMLYFLPVIALVILYLSAQLSIGIYRRKEFS